MKHPFKHMFNRSTAFTLSIVLLLVFCTFFVSSLEKQYNLQVDTTPNQIFSLSNETKTALSGLPSPVIIYTFYSPGNEDIYTNHLLQEYRFLSRKISLENTPSPKNRSLLSQFNIKEDAAPSSIVVTTPDYSRYKVLNLSDLYTIDQDSNAVTSYAESKLTTAILYTSTGTSTRVRIQQGHGETSLAEMSVFVSSMMDLNYEISTYTYPDNATLNPDSDLLIISSPKWDISKEEYTQILQFIKDGGNAMILIDTANFNWNTGKMEVFDRDMTNLKLLLAEFGFYVDSNVIVSIDPASFSLRPTTILLHPCAHEITNVLKQSNLTAVFSEAASVEYDQDAPNITPLLESGPYCVTRDIHTMSGTDNVGYLTTPQSYVVGALWESENSSVVLYSSSLLSNSQINISGNHTLAINTVDVLLQQKGIRLPVKSTDTSYLFIPSGLMRVLMLCIFIFIIPITILLYGLKTSIRYRRK